MCLEQVVGKESRFRTSQRNPDCENPQYWHAVNRTSTEVEVSELVASFVKGLQPELVLETGSYKGQTSVMIGSALKSNKHGLLITIESNLRLVRRVRKACHKLPVKVVWSKSLDYYLPEEAASIDFAFFDSNFESRLLEFDHFYRYMHDRTIVCWHDSGEQWPVNDHVRNLVSEGKITDPLFLPTPRGVCFARVIVR